MENRGNQIFIADVRVLADQTAFSVGMRRIPEERRQRVMQYKDGADRLRSLGAGLLLEYGLRLRGYSLVSSGEGKKMVRLSFGRYGKPYLADAEGVCFNLSHAGDYAAAVFSDCRVGIDIERIREGKELVARRFFCPDEYAYLKKCSAQEKDRVFTELWTKKESYIKAAGEGMHLPLTAFSVRKEEDEADGPFRFRTFDRPPGYVLSVCGGRGAAEITEVDFEAVWTKKG